MKISISNAQLFLTIFIAVESGLLLGTFIERAKNKRGFEIRLEGNQTLTLTNFSEWPDIPELKWSTNKWLTNNTTH